VPTHRQTDRQKKRKKDRQTDRQTHIYTHTYTQNSLFVVTCRLIVMLIPPTPNTYQT